MKKRRKIRQDDVIQIEQDVQPIEAGKLAGAIHKMLWSQRDELIVGTLRGEVAQFRGGQGMEMSHTRRLGASPFASIALQIGGVSCWQVEGRVSLLDANLQVTEQAWIPSMGLSMVVDESIHLFPTHGGVLRYLGPDRVWGDIKTHAGAGLAVEPSSREGRVCLLTTEGRLSSYQVSEKQKRWSRRTTARDVTAMKEVPWIDGRTRLLLVSSSGQLHAFDPETGAPEMSWSLDGSWGVLASSSGRWYHFSHEGEMASFVGSTWLASQEGALVSFFGPKVLRRWELPGALSFVGLLGGEPLFLCGDSWLVMAQGSERLRVFALPARVEQLAVSPRGRLAMLGKDGTLSLLPQSWVTTRKPRKKPVSAVTPAPTPGPASPTPSRPATPASVKPAPASGRSLNESGYSIVSSRQLGWKGDIVHKWLWPTWGTNKALTPQQQSWLSQAMQTSQRDIAARAAYASELIEQGAEIEEEFDQASLCLSIGLLGCAEPPQVIEYLCQRLHHPMRRVRKAAALALQQMGEDVLDSMLPELADDGFFHRLRIHEILEEAAKDVAVQTALLARCEAHMRLVAEVEPAIYGLLEFLTNWRETARFPQLREAFETSRHSFPDSERMQTILEKLQKRWS